MSFINSTPNSSKPELCLLASQISPPAAPPPPRAIPVNYSPATKHPLSLNPFLNQEVSLFHRLKQKGKESKFIVPLPCQSFMLNKNYLHAKEKDRQSQLEFLVNIAALQIDEPASCLISALVSLEGSIK